MINFEIEFESLRETYDIECKAAQGRDGKGEVPRDFWESYSALANTEGGSIFLGIEEKKDKFTQLGIKQPDRVIKQLVDTANNQEKVSINLLDNTDIIQHGIEGNDLAMIIEVRVRRASRKERPVYLKNNPLGNSYRRRHEADQRLSDDEVKRMLADQQHDSLDRRILTGYSFEDDLDIDSFRAFKQACTTRSPESHFDTLSDQEFLKKIRGWRRDRETGEEGLTVAALLMFGRYETITEEFPDYFLDYQERPASKTEQRYVDRVCPDGSWSGNLYDFYRKVYPKLVSDLKVGFNLKDGIREGETPAHVAVREALVNALVHADYSIATSTLIVKRADLFGFKNPGDLRIPLEAAYEGGDSDSRNKIIQDMFRMVGAGERQGFGIRKIRENWKAFDWRVPYFEVQDEPTPRVLLRLSMLSLFPEKAVAYLKEKYLGQWSSFSEIQKVALVVAYTEGAVTHHRLNQLCDEHPRDVSDVLLQLSEQKILATTGKYRSKTYHLPEISLPSPEEVFDTPSEIEGSSPNSDVDSSDLEPSSPNSDLSSPNSDVDSSDLEPSSPNSDLSSPNSDTLSSNLDHLGRILHPQFDYPFVDDLAGLVESFRMQLENTAKEPRRKQRIRPEEMKNIILKLCAGQYLTAGALAELLNREQETLRGQYLTKLKNEGLLLMAFPRTPNDPRQAYITAK